MPARDIRWFAGLEMRLPFEQERGRSEVRVLDPRPAGRRTLCAACVVRAVRSFAMPFAILNYDSAQTREHAVATTARWRIPGDVEVGPRRRRGLRQFFRHVSMACSHGPA